MGLLLVFSEISLIPLSKVEFQKVFEQNPDYSYGPHVLSLSPCTRSSSQQELNKSKFPIKAAVVQY